MLGASEQPADDDGATPARLDTTRGPIDCLLHRAPGGGETAVLWAPGARGGFGGPADGLYADLARELAGRGIASLRLDYRHAANLDESTLDVLAGIWYLAGIGRTRTALVGHSFGGGVVISAARYSSHVRAVVALASQTLGAEDVVLLRPRPLLVVHGEADAVLPVANAELIHGWASEPKRLVTYAGAGHGLRECRAELRELLLDWLTESLEEPAAG
ncbi:MAG: dienelactone hydrolase family protein [Chloroflexi bacterium]|nr:dienelactone hydrolase family protein [Chloroflexota bacterium]